MKNLTTLLFTISAVATFGQVNIIKMFGGASNDRGWSVETTLDGGYAIAGLTNSYGAGGTDIFLIKTDALGNIQWQKTYGGTSNEDIAPSIEQRPDSSYILAGGTDSFGANGTDAWLLRLDKNGNVLSQKKYASASADEFFNVIHLTNDGGYLVAGADNVDGFGSADIVLTKFDANDNEQWKKIYGGVQNQISGRILSTGNNDVYFAGSVQAFGSGDYDIYVARYNSIGNPVWEKMHGLGQIDAALNMCHGVDGGLVTVGYTTSFGAGSNDYTVAKFDTLGNLMWAKAYGGIGIDAAVGIEPCSDGSGYFVVGHSASYSADADILAMKIDPLGNVIWSRSIVSPGADLISWYNGNCMRSTPDGGFVCVGHTSNGSFGGEDIYFIKSDSLGSIFCNDVIVSVSTPPYVTVTANLGINSIGSFASTGGVSSNSSMSEDASCQCVGLTGVSFSHTANGSSVQFNDNSLGSPLSWTWDFGNGQGSTLQNPSYSYPLEGNYFVCLTVDYACGVQETYCDSISICSTNGEAAFSSSTNGLTTQFTDLSTGNPVSWFWDFGNGQFSTAQNPLYIYPTPGTYWVCLTTSFNCGPDAIYCDSIMVNTVGLLDQNFGNVLLYPNPTSGDLHIELGQLFESVKVKQTNLLGQVISEEEYRSTDQITTVLKGNIGIYQVELLINGERQLTISVLKE